MSEKIWDSSLESVRTLGEPVEKNKRKHLRIGETVKKNKRKHSTNTRKRPLKRLAKEQEIARKNLITQTANIKCSEKHISQEIHVKKNDFQCIINLKTTVCEHKDENQSHRKNPTGSRRNKQNTSSSSNRSKVSEKDRKVPVCFRSGCCRSSPYRIRKQRDVFKRNKLDHQRHGDRDKNLCKKTEDKREDHPKPKPKHHKCDLTKGEHKHKQNHSKMLSPISSSSLKDDFSNKLSYEDISTTSLETQVVEIPTSYTPMKHKNVKCKHRQKVKHRAKVGESKLDTLIKRTKERERILVEQSRCTNQPWCTSTPIHNEFSSDNVFLSTSDMDISLTSTLIIDTYSNFAYSPSCAVEELQKETGIYHRARSPSSPTRNENYTMKDPSNNNDNIMFNIKKESMKDVGKDRQSEKELNHRAYSPSSPIRNENYTMKDPTNRDNILVNIKNEPMMDIEAYSPIHSPETTQILAPNHDGKEFVMKTEPHFSAELSPIYYESSSQYNIVKTEFFPIEDGNQSSETVIVSNRSFSITSPLRREDTIKDSANNNDYKLLNIKNEPMTEEELDM